MMTSAPGSTVTTALAGQRSPHFCSRFVRARTAIRPIKEGQEYDLDLSCKLRKGVDRSTHSHDSSRHDRRELESYRNYRHIEERLEPNTAAGD